VVVVVVVVVVGSGSGARGALASWQWWLGNPARRKADDAAPCTPRNKEAAEAIGGSKGAGGLSGEHVAHQSSGPASGPRPDGRASGCWLVAGMAAWRGYDTPAPPLLEAAGIAAGRRRRSSRQAGQQRFWRQIAVSHQVPETREPIHDSDRTFGGISPMPGWQPHAPPRRLYAGYERAPSAYTLV
jgi:hypothetical protein